MAIAGSPRPAAQARRLRTLALAMALGVVGGCSRPRQAPREDAEGGSAPAHELEHVATTPSPTALAEIVAAAPRASVRPTDPDGGTLLGSTTTPPDAGAPSSASARPIDYAAPPATTGPRVAVGQVETTFVSNAAVEQMAREQIYWALVQECRAPDGAVLPPDAVLLEFVIVPDGTVDPGSVKASAENPAFRAAAA